MAVSTSEESLSAVHALRTAQLLHSASSSQAPFSQVQSLRHIQLKNRLVQSERLKVTGNPACAVCGTLLVSGWSATASLVSTRPGKRKRQHRDTFSKIRGTTEQASLSSQAPSTNHFQWRCHGCSSTTSLGGSDAGTKRKFTKVRHHPPAAELLSSLFSDEQPRTVFENPMDRPTMQIDETAQTALRPLAATTCEQSGRPDNSRASSAAIPPSQARPKAASSTTSTSRTASPSPGPARPPAEAVSVPAKKKRGKREGLQAMLQARKDREEQDKVASSGLGLSSFLKGL